MGCWRAVGGVGSHRLGMVGVDLQCGGWAMGGRLPLCGGWAVAPRLPQDGGWAMCGMGVWDREGPRRMYFWAGWGLERPNAVRIFGRRPLPQNRWRSELRPVLPACLPAGDWRGCCVVVA